MMADPIDWRKTATLNAHEKMNDRRPRDRTHHLATHCPRHGGDALICLYLRRDLPFPRNDTEGTVPRTHRGMVAVAQSSRSE